jgi:hypothetical protein
VFTARYALSPYIKQIHFVFKGLRGRYLKNSRLLWTPKVHSKDAASNPYPEPEESRPHPNISLDIFQHCSSIYCRPPQTIILWTFHISIHYSECNCHISDCLRHLKVIRLGDIWVPAIDVKNTEFVCPVSPQGAVIRLLSDYYTTTKPVFHKGLTSPHERYWLPGASFRYLCLKPPLPPLLVFWQVPLRGHKQSCTLPALEQWKYI